MKKRLKWAQEHSKWTQRQWDTVIWSDESRFEVCVGDSRKRVLRTKGEEYHKDCLSRKVKFPASVMIWGCMSAKGLGSLHFVDGIVNAVKYQSILEHHLLPSIKDLSSPEGEYIFQQDGATCHTAKTSKLWLQNHNVPLMEWPSSSPDLSPIETVWHIMKKELRRNPIRTVEQLKLKLKQIWDSISVNQCQDLVNTMSRRCEAVIIRKGDVTQW